jgi:hypothetical protein
MVGRSDRRLGAVICHCMSYSAVVITLAILTAVLAIAVWNMFR